MKLIVTKNYEEMSKKAADIIQDKIRNNPNAILGLATGSTPIGTYEELIKRYKSGKITFKDITTFNLDEYLGLSGDHPQSYRYFMNKEFFDQIDINKKNTFVPNGLAENLEEYCVKYDDFIASKGGVDLQILGIGTNGHIAFNEPDKELSIGTSVVNLTESTIEDNSRFFDDIDQVPKKAITMGLGSILRAKKIILLANGKHKKEVIGKLLETDKISTEFPASFLALHNNVTVIIDEDANYNK